MSVILGRLNVVAGMTTGLRNPGLEGEVNSSLLQTMCTDVSLPRDRLSKSKQMGVYKMLNDKAVDVEE